MTKMRADIERLLQEIPIDFGGGCSASKAFVIAYLIHRYNLKASVDIGVYRGRSLFPQALAHAQHTGGVVYGVDPWSKADAVENDNLKLKEAIDRFVADTDFDAIYQDVCSIRESHGYKEHCELLRMTSSRAAAYFKSHKIKLGLIHIDGNHDTAIVTEDLENYLDLLEPEGFLVMDDISWDSVQPAYRKADEIMPRIFQRVDEWNDYAVFWNTKSKIKPFLLSLTLRQIGRG